MCGAGRHANSGREQILESLSAERERPHADRQRLPLQLMLGVEILLLWLLPMRSSLWADELGTSWIVKDSFTAMLERAVVWSGQSPLYYVTAWAAAKIAPASDVALRVPSLLAMGATLWLLYRLAARLIGRPAALYAALIFAALPPVAFAAADARPYALALLLLVASTVALLKWIERRTLPALLLYSLFAAGACYAHPLFLPGLVVPAVYALWRTRNAVQLAGAWLGAGILCIPLVRQLATFFAERGAHSWLTAPSVAEFFFAILPLPLVGAIAAVALARMLRRGEAGCSWTLDRPVTIFLAAWMLFTPVTYFLLARTSDLQFFHPRYILAFAPGLALLAGALVQSFHAPLARRALAGLFALLSILTAGATLGFQHSRENWRDNLAVVRDLAAERGTVVVVSTIFVEGGTLEAIANPRMRDVLFAQLLRYPLPEDVKVIRLPYEVDAAVMERTCASVVRDARRLVVLLQSDKRFAAEWLVAHAEPFAPRIRHMGRSGSVLVFDFER